MGKFTQLTVGRIADPHSQDEIYESGSLFAYATQRKRPLTPQDYLASSVTPQEKFGLQRGHVQRFLENQERQEQNQKHAASVLRSKISF